MDSPTANSMSLPIHNLAERIANVQQPNNPNPSMNENHLSNIQQQSNNEHTPIPSQPRSQHQTQTNSQAQTNSTSANSNASIQDVMLSKQLQAMMLETLKQQVQVDTSPLDNNHRFMNPSDFLQFSLFTSAIRERVRGRV